MKACAKTDIGAKRNTNQDYVFCSMQSVGSLPNLFIVADGMGGHKAGDFASRYTVETFWNLSEIQRKKTRYQLLKRGLKQPTFR